MAGEAYCGQALKRNTSILKVVGELTERKGSGITAACYDV